MNTVHTVCVEGAATYDRGLSAEQSACTCAGAGIEVVSSSTEPVAICFACGKEYSEAAFQAHPTWRVIDNCGDKLEQIHCDCRETTRVSLSIEHLDPCADCNDGGWLFGIARDGSPALVACRCNPRAE